MQALVRTFVPFFALLFSVHLQGQSIRGLVRAADNGEAVVGATVEMKRNGSEATPVSLATTPEGAFRFESLHPGYYQCKVTAVGYETQTIAEISIAAGREQSLEIALSRSNNTLPNVTIIAGIPGRRVIQPLSEIPLTRDQTLRFPAMSFDPARLAAAYPGVVQTDDGINGMSIRGNNPGSVRWRLEGMDLVNPNHLPNAGTFSDRPATSSGGILMFSAQLLDNSSLLTGAFPAGYGDALGGVMDMNLRNGNTEGRELTFQAGLVGLDVAAEGPLRKGSNNSYLANYRYSTVGILGKMGVSFGGEKINFQDFSFKMHFAGKKGGEWSLFGMGGLSENIYTPPTDSITIYKELFNIDFYSKTGIVGISHRITQGNTSLRAALISSAQENTRSAAGAGIREDDRNQEARTGLSVTVTQRIGTQARLSGGLIAQYATYNGESKKDQTVLFEGDVALFILQTWANWEWASRNKRWSTQVGLHDIVYRTLGDYQQTSTNPEPRLAFSYRLHAKHLLTLAYGYHSQMNPLWLEATTVAGETDFAKKFPYRGAGFVRARHAGLRYTWTPADAWQVKGEAFWQSSDRLLVDPSQPTFSMLNQTEVQTLANLQATGKAEQKGVELSAEHFLTNNWFLAANTTLFNARYQGADGQWRDSRWNLGHLANFTLGKEWYFERKTERPRSFGLNGRLVWMGGFREMPVDSLASAAAQATRWDVSQGFSVQQPDYFRIDLRFYWKRNLHNRRNSTLAMDLQNITNRANVSYHYYDPYTKHVETKYQLGLIPNISWRLEL